VPYPCAHGRPTRPAPFLSRYPRINKNGEEEPPYGGQSWGQGKYLKITAYGGRTSTDGHGKEWHVPFCQIKCPVCLGQPEPADMKEDRRG
jgi:hypothetical protein